MTTSPPRTSYLGSSDAAAVLDRARWPYLWDLKKDLVRSDDGDTSATTFRKEMGKVTEPFHVDWVIKMLTNRGDIVGEIDFSRNVFHVSPKPETSFMGCHPDAVLASADGPYWPLEAKQSSGRWTPEELLEWHMPQIQHILYVMEAPICVYSVLNANLEPDPIFIGRSEEWLKVYIEMAHEFWDYVERGVRPNEADSESQPSRQIWDAVRLNGAVRVSGESIMGNDWDFWEQEYLRLKDAKAAFEEVREVLRKSMPEDAREVYGKNLKLVRSKSGSILFRASGNA